MSLFDVFSRGKEENGENNSDKKLLEEVEVVPGLKVPRAFALHWPEIAKTKLPFISIKATPENDLTLEQSKFGHYPCLPVDFDYPKDSYGKFMFPLAQINFRELPALQGYPASGYLQFYISEFDDVYGLNFDDAQVQKDFRVLYFEESKVSKYMSNFSFLDDVMKSSMPPVSQPHALTFLMKEGYVGLGDVRNENNTASGLSTIIKKFPSIEDALEDASYDLFRGDGHKIGGYAYFTQTDPRIYEAKFRDYILLLQIDTDDEIMWGDAGVGNFFIHPDDLAKKDFSKVVYNWDCS